MHECELTISRNQLRPYNDVGLGKCFTLPTRNVYSARFPPNTAGSQAILAKAGQRLATVIMYLNTPEAGGATDFPNLGLTVTAKKGSVVYFENVDLHGHVDSKSLHAGLPVLAGEKWIATKWLRERALF